MEASGWTLGLLPLLLLLPGAEGQTQVCSVNQTLLSVTENELPTEPLATVTAPLGQTVVVSDLSSPKDIFDIVNGQLRLTRAPDYETHTVLTAMLECKEGSEVVTTLPVIVEVLNVNDMAPVFAFSSKAWNVSENTNVGTTVISATELTAIDKDGDTIFYNLSGQSPSDADLVFSLVGVNFPALQLTRALDYEKTPILVFHLLARDTSEPAVKPSHTSTATVIIQVIPADIRPPWFLPCVFTDGRVCINAQYRAAVPTGSILTLPLTFEPGPVYAIDGDTAINEPIRYSIIAGNADDTFQIDVDSGNVTMAKAVPVPKTFNLVVQAQQKVHTGSYSVTQVTIQAVAGQLNPPRFPQALYRGWLTPGTGINVAVRDAEDPDRELRLRAEDNDFPADVPNSGLHYRITNSSAFRMSGEVVLTNAPVGTQQVLYLEAEVLDELTSENDTTTIEILVQDTKPTPPESTTQGSGTQTSPTSRSTLTRPPTQDSSKPSSPGTTLVPPHSGTTVKPSIMPPTLGAPSPGPGSTLVPSHSGTTVKPSNMSPTQGPPSPGPGSTLVPPHSGTTVKPSNMPPTQGPPSPGPGSTLVPPHSSTTVKPSSTSSTQGPPSPGPGSTLVPSHSGTTVKPSNMSPTQGPPSPGPGSTLVPPHSGTTVKPSNMPPTQGPPSPGPGSTLVPPHSGTTVKPSSTSSTQGPPSSGPTTTLFPPHSGTTMKPSAPPSTQYSPGPPGPDPSGGSQTGAPGGITGETSAAPGGPSPEPSVSSSTSPGPTGGSPGGQEQERSTVNEMAILGGVLGALLFLTLVLMGVFIYKRNGCQKCGLSSKRGTDLKDSGFDNKTFQVQEPSNWVALTSPSPEPGSGPQPLKDETPRRPSSGSVPPPEIKTPSPVVREAEEENRETQDEGSYRTSTEGPVRSILTKERKLEDGGYKAVWFGEDIGAQVDVVVINSPVPEEPEVAPEEPEELEMAYEEPELVLLVSEEPEELLMASVEPLLLSMVSEESKETVVVPEERPKEPDWESEGESEGEPEGEFEGESEEESEVGPEEEHEWEPEVPEESEEEPEESEEEPEESEEEPKEPMVVPAKEPEGEPEESEEHKVVSKEEPKEPMMVPEEEPKEPMVVPKEEPKEPVVVPAKEPEGEPEESEEHKVVPKEEPKEPMMVPEERPREESRGESKADENNVDKNKNGGGEVASPAPEADSPA
ncbi:cadherin-related family member 5 isoform X2 [Notamacropus eugenii]|uniref:cadherin-related family member 5 isoform X2 n=1 Tax=Notamacropus eugenii TaxID=9315 RepID=UPI003B67DD19